MRGGDTISINKSLGACFINPGKHRGPGVVPQLHKECRWLVKMLQESKCCNFILDPKSDLEDLDRVIQNTGNHRHK